MDRKDLIFAIVTTFCLCTLLFSVTPIRSGLPYDPWSDIDGNGKIDMKDIGNVAAQFSTSGDPTKNVNVTNWPTEETVLPETLTFYGVRRRMSNPSQDTYENFLTDHIETFERLEPSVNSVYRMNPGEFKVLTDVSIVLENSFVKTFQVNGTAKIYWEYPNGGLEWIIRNVSLSLQKILSDGSAVSIGSKDYKNIQGGTGNFTGYVYMNVTETFYPGEKLAIRIFDVAKNIQSYQIDVQTSINFCYYIATCGFFEPRFPLYVKLPAT